MFLEQHAGWSFILEGNASARPQTGPDLLATSMLTLFDGRIGSCVAI